jgi:hypothetical protein
MSRHSRRVVQRHCRLLHPAVQRAALYAALAVCSASYAPAAAASAVAGSGPGNDDGGGGGGGEDATPPPPLPPSPPSKSTQPVTTAAAAAKEPATRHIPQRAFTGARYYPGRDGQAMVGQPLLHHPGGAAQQADPTGYRQKGEALSRACTLGRPVGEVKRLLDEGADAAFVDDLPARPGHKGRLTPLLRAIEAGSPELVELLLERGASASRAERNGDTPLIVAARRGTGAGAIVQVLLDQGAPVAARQAFRYTGMGSPARPSQFATQPVPNQLTLTLGCLPCVVGGGVQWPDGVARSGTRGARGGGAAPLPVRRGRGGAAGWRGGGRGAPRRQRRRNSAAPCRAVGPRGCGPGLAGALRRGRSCHPVEALAGRGVYDFVRLLLVCLASCCLAARDGACHVLSVVWGCWCVSVAQSGKSGTPLMHASSRAMADLLSRGAAEYHQKLRDAARSKQEL